MIVRPDTMRGRKVTAFFTTKKTGADSARIASVAGIGEDDIYMPRQRHTDGIQILRHDRARKVADAVITRKRNVLIGVAVADCVPILLYDSGRGICGSVHAGWRGTAKGILRKTVERFCKDFYADPRDIVVAIGPAIRWCCYCVGSDVLHAVMVETGEGDYYERRDGKICLDLPSANRQQAVHSGVPERNIWVSDECTYCSPDRYYSYRYARGPTGRQGGFIGVFV